MGTEMAEYIGKWNLIESEGFDEVMKELEVSFMVRKMANMAKPTITFTADGDDGLTFMTESTFKTSTYTFKFGEEFEEALPDGRKVKSVFTKESDKCLKQTQKDDKRETLIIRTVEGEIMVTNVSVNGKTSVRKYKK